MYKHSATQGRSEKRNNGGKTRTTKVGLFHTQIAVQRADIGGWLAGHDGNR